MFTSKGFNTLSCVLAYFPIGITQNWSPLSFMGLTQPAGAQIFFFLFCALTWILHVFTIATSSPLIFLALSL